MYHVIVRVVWDVVHHVRLSKYPDDRASCVQMHYELGLSSSLQWINLLVQKYVVCHFALMSPLSQQGI